MELVDQARGADRISEHPVRSLFRRPRRPFPQPYAGVLSPAIALGIDAALVGVTLPGISTLVALLFNAVNGDNPSVLEAALAGAVAWAVVGTLYLTTFWSLTGQTPGMRFMSIKG